jgi:holin-like protein
MKPTEAGRRRAPAWPLTIWDLGGLAVIVLSFIAGSWVVGNFDLPIPNGVMGMIILLGLLRLSVVPVEFVRRASAGLLYLLPVLFVPLYVEPFSDGSFWARYATSVLPIVVIGGAAMLLLAYFLAWMLRR